VPSGEISGQAASAIFFEWGIIDVGNENLSTAIVCDLALRRVKDRRKRDAKEDCNNELFHALGALTLGKRAFLISRFRFFPSVDIR